jgi:hypothetical protein
MTSTPIYTMEVSSSSGRIEKFSGRPCIISLREFKATFSTMVCELELKYGANYTEVFAFKQLACYVHYGALDVATLALGLRPRQRGLQGYGPKGKKPESEGKGIARVWAKRIPGSHITYSWECKKM